MFCYHFTTEPQRKISTEQAESLPGKLIDEGILVKSPFSKGSPTWVYSAATKRTPSTLPDLILCAEDSTTVWLVKHDLTYQSEIPGAVCEGRLPFSRDTKLRFLGSTAPVLTLM